MAELYKQALNQDMSNPSPVTGYLWIGSHIHLVAVSPITSDIAVNTIEKNKNYGLLVFTKQFDNDLLQYWAEQYQFGEIQLYKNQPVIQDKYVYMEYKLRS